MAKSVSLFVHSLGDNPIVRVLPIARALQKLGYETEVLGFLLGGDEEVHSSYGDEIDPFAIQTDSHPAELFPNVRRLAHAATGDMVYAFKPLVTTLAPAYYAARVVENKPLLLDVEDENVYGDQIRTMQDVWRKVFRGWRLGTSWKYTRLTQLLRLSVDAVTVVSTKLQRRYGGTIIRHGPEENEFCPDRNFNTSKELREKWDLPTNRKLAVFTGTPRSHKGIDVLAEALSRPECGSWDFVLVGPSNSESVRSLRGKLQNRSHFVGPQPYHRVPQFLSLADAVPIPQKETSFAEAQVPAKLLDAMAMARPIVATRVGDLPSILGNGTRGWLVEPGSPASLAKALNAVESQPEESERRGERARKWYEENASTKAIAKKLRKIIKYKV